MILYDSIFIGMAGCMGKQWIIKLVDQFNLLITARDVPIPDSYISIDHFGGIGLVSVIVQASDTITDTIKMSFNCISRWEKAQWKV